MPRYDVIAVVSRGQVHTVRICDKDALFAATYYDCAADTLDCIAGPDDAPTPCAWVSYVFEGSRGPKHNAEYVRRTVEASEGVWTEGHTDQLDAVLGVAPKQEEQQ